MKKLEKIIGLLLKIVELLPMLIEFLRALDRDTDVIKTKLDSLDLQITSIQQVTDSKQVSDKQVTDAKQVSDKK